MMASVASVVLLKAAVSMMSHAKRLDLKHGYRDVPLVPMMNPPLPTIQATVVARPAVRARVDLPLIAPELGANQSALFSVASPGWSDKLDSGEFQIKDSARTSEAVLLVEPSLTESGLATDIDYTVKLPEVKPVTSLELKSFLGRWYQMYGSVSSTIVTMGKDGPQGVQDLCTATDYSLNKDGKTINMFNQGFSVDGRLRRFRGTAKATDLAGRKKLSLKRVPGFFEGLWKKLIKDKSSVDPPEYHVEGDYVIYKLGSIASKKYQYTIVGSNSPVDRKLGRDQTKLFVLARNPKDFDTKYGNEVQRWLDDNGFDNLMINKGQCGKVDTQLLRVQDGVRNEDDTAAALMSSGIGLGF